MSHAIPVLLYHSVPRAGSSDPLAVSHERFKAQMQAVSDSGRTALTVSELAAGLKGSRGLPARTVAITFDDGHANNLAAIELLRESDLRATLYLTTAEIGSPGMLAGAQAARLAAHRNDVEIGAHSVTHAALDELASADAEREISASKQRLEQLLGREIESFAYPFGAYDRRVREAVIAAGYRSAVAVKNALSHPNDDPWAIARWTVRADTTIGQLTRVLDGEGIPHAWRHERLRTRGYRHVRRLRRRVSAVGARRGPTAADRRGT